MRTPIRIAPVSFLPVLWLALVCASACGREGNEVGSAEAASVPPPQAQAPELQAEPAAPVPSGPSPRELARQRQLELAESAAGVAARLTEASSHAAIGARWRLAHNGLPRNTRQTPEGYWVGAEPDAGHLAELYARGVRVVLSGTRLSSAARTLADELGMRHIDVPFGGRFPDHATLTEGTRDHLASQIYIHCEHGGDRSGAMLAFLLATREAWPASRALIAVAYPNGGDIRRLVALMRDEGVDVDEADAERYAGIYSPELNGGFGGLKVRGDSYRKLVVTTLAAMRDVGAL